MEKCYKCGKDVAPGRFLKIRDCWTQEGFHWYAACEDCYCAETYGLVRVKDEEAPKKMVTKVKIIGGRVISYEDFEYLINKAIRGLDVIDIKYADHSAMIIYREEE